MADDKIPTDGAYRGVPLHAGQAETRLQSVRDDIDAVYALGELDHLVPFAGDSGRAPEARLFAKAKALAIVDQAVESRAARSRTTAWTRERIKASAVGCDSIAWRDALFYGSLLDGGPEPGNNRRVRREILVDGL